MADEHMQKAVNLMNKMKDDKKLFLKIILHVVLIVLILTLIFYWSTQTVKKNAGCNAMNDLYTEFPSISSISSNDSAYTAPLCEYYIKSSYNSCCAGQYENDWVDMCALYNVIKQGCRVLDFEIYNIDSKPVVSVSASTNDYEKGTYNYLSFDSVMNVVADNAFSGSSCPNPGDPLILFFRIMSTDSAIYNVMADDIGESLSNYVLGEPYSYESRGQNLGSVPINELLGKVIIVVTDKSGTFRSTKLDEYVNIAGNEVFLYVSTEHEVIYAASPDDTLEHNRLNMTICTPNLSAAPNNYNPTAVMQYGVQMPLMSFQTNDTYLQVYNNIFSTANHAFVRKPESMRYTTTSVDPPEPLSKDQQYGTTNYQGGVSEDGKPLWNFDT